MTTLLCDIGGTYVRFAQERNNTPNDIIKYETKRFKALSEALDTYCQDQDIKKQGHLLIAAAGSGDDQHWTITNNKNFEMNLDIIRNQGWHIPIFMNDFEATAYALPILADGDLQILKPAHNTSQSLCVIGAGTGLGLSYYHGAAKCVQSTHGGHIPVASLNDEHGRIIKELRAGHDKPLVFEDLLSGQNHLGTVTFGTKSECLQFSYYEQFLGIFAATAVITGHAYGGLYLTGGIIQNLLENDQFNLKSFLNSFVFDAVPCVKKDLENTSITYIKDPYPALKGLIHAKSILNN